VLRNQYEKEGEHVGLQTKFNYAWVLAPHHNLIDMYAQHRTGGTRLTFFSPALSLAQGLIKSSDRQDAQEGVRLLSEIYRNAPERRRECLYYLALGNYKLGNYADARRYNELLLGLEPANLQAGSLKGLIDDKVNKEGLMGAAIVGGLAVAAGVVGGLIFRSARKR